MKLGRVYLWTPDGSVSHGGSVRAEVVELQRLDAEGPGAGRLWGRYARVRNAGRLPADPEAAAAATPLGDARPDEAGNYIFDPAAGGPRVDRGGPIEDATRERYLQAARFGEVNTYYHLDRIGAYVDGLLHELGEPSLPRVTAVVNAHPAAGGSRGLPDGVQKKGRWVPFQGGHYRLPGPRSRVLEQEPISPDGEIHLGPGWEILDGGALALTSGGRYRHNASHNAGILYHEYGHHVARHTADFRRNAVRPRDLQDNWKTSLEEGVCDFWAATVLNSPHIWSWHRLHDGKVIHRRSLASGKTMADFDAGGDADPHANGTIAAAALWDLRTSMGDPRRTDLLLLRSLLLWAELPPDVAAAHRDGPQSFRAALALLIRADAEDHASRHGEAILAAFGRRGIHPLREVADFPGRRFVGSRYAHGA